MFKKSNRNESTITSSAPVAPLGRSHSVLSPSTTFTGDVVSKDDLRIDGHVEGNISCEGKVIIGTDGCITGNIKAASIELMGKIIGDAVVTEIMRLKSTSFFKGEITAENIEIEAGANFYGNCRMTDQQSLEQPFVAVQEEDVAE
ncbi:polymer-forming cytoskeletal protein [Dysgonomonas sp. 511]|uniref:bactofilin family protein n=1 Tax=Dysgonomonas sp. 511 TaxID=2302930 RepID=UPI0013D3ACBA|nr:polymer-forming cytoskeletal protein [Dysgonomonas sp. 511]NDV77825.1 polymer-forming cytoskeletal protein [Dysgonomonas sp. 511]